MCFLISRDIGGREWKRRHQGSACTEGSGDGGDVSAVELGGFQQQQVPALVGFSAVEIEGQCVGCVGGGSGCEVSAAGLKVFMGPAIHDWFTVVLVVAATCCILIF